MIDLFIPTILYLSLDYCPFSKQLSLIPVQSIWCTEWERGPARKIVIDNVIQDWFTVAMEKGLHSGSLNRSNADISPFCSTWLCIMNKPRFWQSAWLRGHRLFSFSLYHWSLYLVSSTLPCLFCPSGFLSQPDSCLAKQGCTSQMSHLSSRP